LSIKVNASQGARVISFAYQDIEILTQSAVHSTGFGSTLWDAPQSRWDWPPPPTLDSAPYAAIIEADQLQFISEVDSVSGLQFSKRIRLVSAPLHAELEYSIKNCSDAPVTVGAWEITRVPGGLTFFPSTQLAANAPSNLPDLHVVDEITWYTFNKAHLPAGVGRKGYFDVNKRAAHAWLATVAPTGLIFAKAFPAVRPEHYSQGQAVIEVYGHEFGSYMELENQGPRTLLEPGAALTYAVQWFVQPIPSDIKPSVGNAALVEFAQAIVGA
jgi:hypothetical protein